MENLLKILESVLGESKCGISENNQLQVQFRCPICGDGSENEQMKLELNLRRGIFRCWRCCETHGTQGFISKLLKQVGGSDVVRSYNNQIKEIKKSKEYQLNFENGDFFIQEDIDEKLKFPENTYDFKFDNNFKEKSALDYLVGRGYNHNFIQKYGFKYTTHDCPNINFRNRIIIPSYDKYDELNYYSARDYIGKAKQKYYNAEDTNKLKIIFNENFINPDADIILAEGIFDAMSLPNALPLMGKTLSSVSEIYNYLIKYPTQNIIIFLDNDAMADAQKIAQKLNNAGLCGRIKIIDSEDLRQKIVHGKKIELKKLDPGELYKKFGVRGVSWALKNAINFEDDCF